MKLNSGLVQCLVDMDSKKLLKAKCWPPSLMHALSNAAHKVHREPIRLGGHVWDASPFF